MIIIHLLHRFGLVQRRAVWGLLLLALLAAVVLWLEPWRGLGPRLRLVALTPAGTFDDTVRVGDTVEPARSRDGLFAVPLVLGAANAGEESARPGRLELLLPPTFRLVDRGMQLRGIRPPGEPLVRYVLDGPFPAVEGQRVPVVLPIDSLWLEPVLRTHYCVVGTDSIPELIAAQAGDIEQLRTANIFYSFEGGNLDFRQPGLLTVQMPGALFARAPSPPVPAGPVQIGRPEAERPPITALVLEGTRDAVCGGPGDPIEIFTATWRTLEGGRFMVVHYGGVPRKQYFDLNADSVIELEMWDPDGDGLYEASRATSIPIPEFLLPAPEPLPDSMRADSMRADSVLPDSLRDAAIRYDSLGRPILPLDTGRYIFPGVPGMPGMQPVPVPGAGEPGAQPDAQQPEPEPEPEPEPAPPPPPRGEVPLGTPVP